jgi:hypothetical protein
LIAELGYITCEFTSINIVIASVNKRLELGIADSAEEELCNI